MAKWGPLGCTNNNYASREKCKKCGQPKEVAAMPAVPIPSIFSHSQGSLQQSMNVGILGNNPFHQAYSANSSWLGIGTNRFGVYPSLTWPLGGNNGAIVSYTNDKDQHPGGPKGWRNGDWICCCGFHNYSSRSQCKKCNAAQPALGIKRLASDDLVHDFDNKRLNSGTATSSYLQSYAGSGEISGYNSGSSDLAPNMQLHIHLPQLASTSALMGKGAKQWRVGDWMCTNCNNHNYASRLHCNRCKTERTAILQHVDVGL